MVAIFLEFVLNGAVTGIGLVSPAQTKIDRGNKVTTGVLFKKTIAIAKVTFFGA